MANNRTWQIVDELPPPRNLPETIARLMNVLFWLDANGHAMAAINVNDALEKLLQEQPG